MIVYKILVLILTVAYTVFLIALIIALVKRIKIWIKEYNGCK